MADESYGSVGTPRIYIDYISFCKSVGMIDSYSRSGVLSSSSKANELFDYNPTNTKTIRTSDSSDVRYGCKFKNYENADNSQLSHLLKSFNYFGVLGHNLGLTSKEVEISISGKHTDGTSVGTKYVDSGDDILGSQTSVGCTLFKIDEVDTYDAVNYGDIKFVFRPKSETYNNDIINIGTLTLGRTFDLPHSANLSLNQTISYDGVKTKRTMGGSDLTQVNYLRPKWGDFSQWTSIEIADDEDAQSKIAMNDFSTAGFQGRRSWDLSFSYISKEDMFPRSYSNNTTGYYDYDDTLAFDDGDNSTGLYTDNFVNNYLNLTLGGQISHILQVDKDKPTDFAIVKMDMNSLQITQQAPMLYQFKVKLVEQF